MQDIQSRAPSNHREGWDAVATSPHQDWEKPITGDPAIRQLPPTRAAGPKHGESPVQRLDRAYAEILQEVRIAQCGINILFASLLSLGVTPAFTGSTGLQRAVYCASLACSIGAAGTLLAPAAVHRFMWGHRVKRELVAAAHRYLVAGLTFLALAISSALMLILDLALGTTLALTGSAGALAWFVLLWFLSPMHARNRARRVYPNTTPRTGVSI
ncbi:DUF6328 family protein [Streptomyces sp. NPDC002306]